MSRAVLDQRPRELAAGHRLGLAVVVLLQTRLVTLDGGRDTAGKRAGRGQGRV